MRTTHIKSNVVNNGVPKLPTSDAIYYGEIAINYGASGETLSIKNSNDEIVPFSSDNAIHKAFEVHAQSLIDLDYNYKAGLIDLQVGLESILCRYCS